MELNYKKILGLAFLLGGVVLIGWTALCSYNIFTGEKEAPQIFNAPPNSDIKTPPNQNAPQEQLENIVQEQIDKIFHREDSAKMLNLISWSVLAFILMMAGGKISALGIKLL